MRYSQIRPLDISNGEGVGISLFIQGCHLRCNGCFNEETWNFNGGKEWTEEIEKEFLELTNRLYIKRISILGGEPLAEENLNSVLKLLKKFRILFGNTKTVWLYTGYTWENIWNDDIHSTDIDNRPYGAWSMLQLSRQDIIKRCDVVVDGRFEKHNKDLSLPFRGSSNQRIIDIQDTLANREISLYGKRKVVMK